MTLSLNLPLTSITRNLHRSWMLPKDKLVLELPGEVSLCPSGQHWLLTTTRWAQGSTAGLVQKARPAQLPCSSCLRFAALQWHRLAGPPGPWQREVLLLTFLSFSTCRKEMGKTRLNPLRSLFWKGKSGSRNTWAGVSQAGFFSNDFSLTIVWGNRLAFGVAYQVSWATANSP